MAVIARDVEHRVLRAIEVHVVIHGEIDQVHTELPGVGRHDLLAAETCGDLNQAWSSIVDLGFEVERTAAEIQCSEDSRGVVSQGGRRWMIPGDGARSNLDVLLTVHVASVIDADPGHHGTPSRVALAVHPVLGTAHELLDQGGCRMVCEVGVHGLFIERVRSEEGDTPVAGTGIGLQHEPTHPGRSHPV